MKLRDIRRRAKTKYVSIGGIALLRDCVSKRCRTYSAGCPVCDGWKFYDTHGRFATNDDWLNMQLCKLWGDDDE